MAKDDNDYELKNDVPIIEREALDRLKERQELLKQQNWVVEDIFEKGEIHLLSGPSGVGKSTWVLQFIKDWSEGKPIFGKHKSYPEPYAYIVCDRSFLLTAMTLKRLGLENWNVPMFTIDELQRECPGEKITLEKIADMLPWVKVFFIEAIGWFEPTFGSKQMGYTEGLNFWGDIRNRFAPKGLTIIATTHSPKAKGKERYGHSRERVMGTGATGGTTATIITFDFEDECNATDPSRILTISPRNYPNQVLRYKLDEFGRFSYADVFEGEEKEDEKAVYLIHKELQNVQVGDLIDNEAIRGWKERTGIGKTQLYRVIKQLLDVGVIKRIKVGMYRLEKPVKRLVNQ